MKPDHLKKIAKELGQRGGQKTLEKLGKEHFSKIGKAKKKSLKKEGEK